MVILDARYELEREIGAPRLVMSSFYAHSDIEHGILWHRWYLYVGNHQSAWKFDSAMHAVATFPTSR